MRKRGMMEGRRIEGGMKSGTSLISMTTGWEGLECLVKSVAHEGGL